MLKMLPGHIKPCNTQCCPNNISTVITEMTSQVLRVPPGAVARVSCVYAALAHTHTILGGSPASVLAMHNLYLHTLL